MYIERDIDKDLISWKESSKRKPLLLRGVRQCGKTSVVRHLAERFEYYAEINFEKHPSLTDIFENDIDPQRILSRLELAVSVPIIPGKTLLFMDEIQNSPRAVTSLRYFYEELPSLHVIAAGSLLEFVLNGKKEKNVVEFPVGRVRSIFMYPLSFREFLRGNGQEMLYRYICELNPDQKENDAHEELLEAYKTFLVVGGMPEAAAVYFESKSLLNCQAVHRDILFSMMDDFDKYHADVPADIIRRVFDYAIYHVCTQTKASSAIPGVSAYYFDESIHLLRRAGLVYPVKASSCDTIPLGTSEKATNKKLLVFDTGVYLTECKLDVGAVLSANTFADMNRGEIVEMQTGLEMVKYADAYREASLFYWYRTGANAEVDYVTERGGIIFPLEVKASGKGSMQSLYSFLKLFPHTPYGIRISMESFGKYDNIRVLPVYAIWKLSETALS